MAEVTKRPWGNAGWAWAAVQRANRLQRLIELNAPKTIIENERRLLLSAAYHIVSSPEAVAASDNTKFGEELPKFEYPASENTDHPAHGKH